jgi:hypothetical protein
MCMSLFCLYDSCLHESVRMLEPKQFKELMLHHALWCTIVRFLFPGSEHVLVCLFPIQYAVVHRKGRVIFQCTVLILTFCFFTSCPWIHGAARKRKRTGGYWDMFVLMYASGRFSYSSQWDFMKLFTPGWSGTMQICLINYQVGTC